MRWKLSLPMYAVSADIAQRYDALLVALVEALRAQGWRGAVDVEPNPALPAFWERPDMLLSQTCGYPYMTRLRHLVKPIATPCFDFPGCEGSDYSSVIVVRAGGAIAALSEARGRIAVANDGQSNSGMNVLRHAVAPLARAGRFFADVKWSGSHAASLRMLRDGEADIGAIDCVTFGYLKECAPASLEGLVILQYSAVSPGLPIVAGSAVGDDLVACLRLALLEPDARMAELMRSLHIQAFRHCTSTDYERVLALESAARELGYPSLA